MVVAGFKGVSCIRVEAISPMIAAFESVSGKGTSTTSSFLSAEAPLLMPAMVSSAAMARMVMKNRSDAQGVMIGSERLEVLFDYRPRAVCTKSLRAKWIG